MADYGDPGPDLLSVRNRIIYAIKYMIIFRTVTSLIHPHCPALEKSGECLPNTWMTLSHPAHLLVKVKSRQYKFEPYFVRFRGQT